MTVNGIKLVCFDLGGVVIRICRSWAEGCAAAGISLRDDPERARTEPFRREIIHRYQTGRIEGDEFARRISDLLDGLYSPHEVMTVHQAWMIDEYAGVAAIVEALHRAGIMTACLSNTNHEHWIEAIRYPAVARLRHHFVSHLLGLHKPEPEIYHALQRQLGLDAAEILFFDDMPENVEGARTVGWRAERIDPTACTATQIAAHLRNHGIVTPITSA